MLNSYKNIKKVLDWGRLSIYVLESRAAVQGGDVKDVVKAGAIAGVSSYLGGQLPGDPNTLTFSRFAAASTLGGISSMLSGGSFGRGFASAGLSQLLGGRIQGNVYEKAFAAGLVGGTVSKLTGGKFANGAVTGAFSVGVSELSGSSHEPTKEQIDKFKENKRLAEQEIDKLYKENVLSSSETFNSQDSAAKTVLEKVSVIGDDYDLELAGDIVSKGFNDKGKELFGYTKPEVVGITGGGYSPGRNALSSYHNHPDIDGIVTSPKFSWKDAKWVKVSGKPLYMMNRKYRQFRRCDVGVASCSGSYEGAHHRLRNGTVLKY